MKDESILRPTLESVRSVWDENKPEDTSPKIDAEDQLLSQLSKQAGWKILKEHIQGLKDGLDKRLAESVLQSLGKDQIQTDAVFAVLGKELLTSIVNKVEDSAEQVDEITGNQ